jgi:hypothetical protein
MISILSCREKKLDAKHMLIALSAYVGGKKTHVVGCQLFFIKAKIYRGEDELLF